MFVHLLFVHLLFVHFYTLAKEADPRPKTSEQFDTNFNTDASLLGGPFEFVSYQEVDTGQREEFEALLRKVGLTLFLELCCYLQSLIACSIDGKGLASFSGLPTVQVSITYRRGGGLGSCIIL